MPLLSLVCKELTVSFAPSGSKSFINPKLLLRCLCSLQADLSGPGVLLLHVRHEASAVILLLPGDTGAGKSVTLLRFPCFESCISLWRPCGLLGAQLVGAAGLPLQGLANPRCHPSLCLPFPWPQRNILGSRESSALKLHSTQTINLCPGPFESCENTEFLERNARIFFLFF